MNMFKKNGGFTLVELIVVIAILAILAGVAIPAYSGYIKKAEDAAVITELDAIATAAQGANASSGEISKIVVTATTTNGNTTTSIVVYGKATTTTSGNTTTTTYDALATNFGDDFELYYAGANANAAAADKSVTITISKAVLGGSYSAGATWQNGKWTANTAS